MALTRTTLKQEQSAGLFGTGAFTTSSFTPSNTVLLVCRISAETAAGGAFVGTDLTIAGGGLTWTRQVASTTNVGGWTNGIAVWTAPVTTGASMTVTADAGSANINRFSVDVYQESGYDTSTPVGATANGTDADGQGSATITLSASPASDSEIFGFAEIALSGGASSATPGTSWTELWDVSEAGWQTAHSEVITGVTSTSVSWNNLDVAGGSGVGALLVALEIKAAAGGGATFPVGQILT